MRSYLTVQIEELWRQSSSHCTRCEDQFEILITDRLGIRLRLYGVSGSIDGCCYLHRLQLSLYFGPTTTRLVHSTSTADITERLNICECIGCSWLKYLSHALQRKSGCASSTTTKNAPAGVTTVIATNSSALCLNQSPKITSATYAGTNISNLATINTRAKTRPAVHLTNKANTGQSDFLLDHYHLTSKAEEQKNLIQRVLLLWAVYRTAVFARNAVPVSPSLREKLTTRIRFIMH